MKELDPNFSPNDLGVEDEDGIFEEAEVSGGKDSKTPALKAFGRDLTELATNSELDPVIGRIEEIERVVQILCRRTKNNPVLIGEAGVGKTMLMDICFASIKIKKKKRIHFQEFMIDIHNRLHKIRDSKQIKDPLATVAEEVASEIKFLCFDEFQVTDIADASILKKLFTILFEQGTIIFSTSNIKP